MQIEPDAFLYKLVDRAGNKYSLLCRDYILDNFTYMFALFQYKDKP